MAKNADSPLNEDGTSKVMDKNGRLRRPPVRRPVQIVYVARNLDGDIVEDVDIDILAASPNAEDILTAMDAAHSQGLPAKRHVMKK